MAVLVVFSAATLAVILLEDVVAIQERIAEGGFDPRFQRALTYSQDDGTRISLRGIRRISTWLLSDPVAELELSRFPMTSPRWTQLLGLQVRANCD